MSCELRIGLTGGIGSGKSEAATRFSQLGIPVIDTDVIARELVLPGQEALSEILATFGSELLDADGLLNRAQLRKLVFSDAEKRQQLEDILHPRILEKVIAETLAVTSGYCVVVVPLLIETGSDYPVDRVLVIDTPTDLQIERVRARDDLSGIQIDAILSAQATREERLNRADDVILNDGNLESLREKVDELHQVYLSRSRGPLLR